MYRDFSEKSRNELLKLVSDVENEKASDFTDWIGDRWYDFESWIGKLNIKNYLNNINAYHKKVIDKNNATKSSINEIFAKVKEIDSSYENTLSGMKFQLQLWQRYIDELSQIINPGNGKYNVKAMSDALDGLLEILAKDELNSELGEYVEFDETTQKYIYHWDEINKLFTKDNYSMTDVDYEILLFILSTMVGKNGQITDLENLQKYINAGYTMPSPVTANDFHISFDTLQNGNKLAYYYIQNKSYMSDTLKVICAKYDELCKISDSETELNALLKVIAENYSVIEWRQKLDYTNPIVFQDMERDTWTGKLSISQEVLNKFNDMCKPEISLKFVDEKGSMDYFLITSNSTNIGNVRTGTNDGKVVKRNDPKEDNFSNCTIRVYWNSKKTDLADLEGLNIYAKSVVANYYEEFDIESVLTEELVDIVSSIPMVGKYIKTMYDISTQAEIIDTLAPGIDGVKNTDIKDISNISEKTESKIDTGLGVIKTGIGIYTKYKAVDVNNDKVKGRQDAIDGMNANLQKMKNYGLRYNTMIIKYDHTEYTNDGIKVDNSKNCDIVPNVDVSFSDISIDKETLETQYNYHRGLKLTEADVDSYHTKASDGSIVITETGLTELEKQMKIYLETGKLEENSILAEYLEEIA